MAKKKKKMPGLNTSSTADISFMLLIFFLITTIFGIVVALILQVFYNYILSRVEALTSNMEEAAQEILTMCVNSDKCKK